MKGKKRKKKPYMPRVIPSIRTSSVKFKDKTKVIERKRKYKTL